MQKPLHGPTMWKDMIKSAWKDNANWRKRRQNNITKFPVPCLDDHSCKKEELEPVGEPSEVRSIDGLEMFLSGTIDRPDILW